MGRTLAQFRETALVRPNRVAMIFQVNTLGKRFAQDNVSPAARTFTVTVHNRSSNPITLQLKQAAATRPISDYSQAIGKTLTTSNVNAMFPQGNGESTPPASSNEVTIVKLGIRTFDVVLSPGKNMLIIQGKTGITAGKATFEVGCEQYANLAFITTGQDRFGEQTFLDGADAYGFNAGLNATPAATFNLGNGGVNGPTSVEIGDIGTSAIRYAVSLRGVWGGATAAIQYYAGMEDGVAQWKTFLDEDNNALAFTADNHDTYIAPYGKIRVVLTGTSGTTKIATAITPLAN